MDVPDTFPETIMENTESISGLEKVPADLQTMDVTDTVPETIMENTENTDGIEEVRGLQSMDVMEEVPETIMENTKSIGENIESPEDEQDLQMPVRENVEESHSDFITSLLEDSFNPEKYSPDNNPLIDESVMGLELPQSNSPDSLEGNLADDITKEDAGNQADKVRILEGDIDVQQSPSDTTIANIPEVSDLMKSTVTAKGNEMEKDTVQQASNDLLIHDETEASPLEEEEPVMSTNNEEAMKNTVQQPSTQIILSDDESDACEVNKSSPEMSNTLIHDETEGSPLEEEPVRTLNNAEATKNTVQEPSTEIILSDDESDSEEEPVRTTNNEEATKNIVQQPCTEIIVSDDESDACELDKSSAEMPLVAISLVDDEEESLISDTVAVSAEKNLNPQLDTIVADVMKDVSGDTDTNNMTVKHVEEEKESKIEEVENKEMDRSLQINTEKVHSEAECSTPEFVPAESVSSSDKESECLNVENQKESGKCLEESDRMEAEISSDHVGEKNQTTEQTKHVNSEEVGDADTVFVHVSTGSEKDNGDKTTPEKSSATQEEETFEDSQPQEDPIGSDDCVAVPLDDNAEPDPSVEEPIDEEQGASEAMCIIPDTERIISQAEKDAVASMVPLRDPTESELFSNDPSCDSVTELSKGSNPENYIVSRCTDENVNSCMQCCLPRKSKYSIVHKKNTTYICDDGCLSNFKRTHADQIVMNSEGDLRVKKLTSGGNNDNMVAKVKFCRKCAECQQELVLNDVHLSWQTMEFCKELCLSKYQKKVGSKCSNCDAIVRTNCLGKYCVRFGYNIRQFCSSGCLEEFKKGLKVCSYCQKDMSSGGGDGFLAPVGDKGQFKDFCTQTCMEKYDIMSNGKNLEKSGMCSVCLKEKPTTVEFQHENKMNFFCGEPCFVAFKFVNNITPGKCNMCKKYFDNKILEENSMFYENALLSFCTKSCQNIYIIGHRKIVPCNWCKVKKYNFDMINRLSSSGGSSLLMCSLNCLNLYQVSINAVQSTKKCCDHCQKSLQPLYHLTMSDATIRNFCSYACVMAFQNQFSKAPITLNELEKSVSPVPTSGPKKSRKLLKSKKKESAPVDLPTIPTIPVISSVQSLATTNGPSLSPTSGHRTKNNATTTTRAQSPPIVKTKILRQFIIKPTPIPPHRNIGTMCKVNTKSKEVSVVPTTRDIEVQTDEVKDKTSIIPIPVPIYVPAPMWMYSMPIPTPFPFPLPVPVPIFIPTTRNSATGIMKEIKKIQVKIPTDPFEAELLMMAEMVAGDKKEERTDSESEEEEAPPPPEEPTFSPEPVDPVNTFGDDMLQMALKMATELEEPAVDLEGALTVNTITASQGEEATPTPEASEQSPPPVPIIERQSNRGRKRTSRPPKSAAMTSKRGRRTSMHVDIPITPPQPVPPQEPVEKPDANMCLKYTFGVNAWKQWVTTKNAELEKSSRRMKLFKPEILQLTADELNFSLCLFVKEVRKPNGQEYAPDTIYYLCLGIQQYLFENARIDNIFCDSYYEKFTDCLDDVAKKFSVLYNDSHYIVTRVEEEHLWESKQLGAHSPHVLLSTLMFFNTKHFNLTTVDEHMQLSFSHIMKHWKRNPNQPGTTKTPGSRNVLLRFYPPQVSNTDTPPRKKKVYEQQENEDNPLRCPVKLYEFYLSKCPESVKTRNDVFYLLPERSCVPDSPVWYSTMPLPRAALEKMLHRIKMVKEINVALLTS